MPIPSSTATVIASPTPDFTATPVDTRPVWEIKANWTPANQIRALLIDQNGDLWTGGPAGVVHWDLKTNTPTVYAIRGNPENTNVFGLSQTQDGSIWVGTYGNGLSKFDGKSWQTFTKKDGLPGNFITAQTVTSQGELWLVILGRKQIMESAQFGYINDSNWIQENGGAFDYIFALPDDSIISTYTNQRNGLFYSEIAIYDGHSWNNPDIYPNDWIEAITVAPDGAIWFAAGDTVYRHINHKTTKMIPPWIKEYYHQIVSSIVVSNTGITWFGFSFHTGFDFPCGHRQDQQEEYGTYRYDGKWWIHFTTKDGLIDNKICAITTDKNNNVWFGSYDKGVSRFDGQVWTSYVVP